MKQSRSHTLCQILLNSLFTRPLLWYKALLQHFSLYLPLLTLLLQPVRLYEFTEKRSKRSYSVRVTLSTTETTSFIRPFDLLHCVCVCLFLSLSLSCIYTSSFVENCKDSRRGKQTTVGLLFWIRFYFHAFVLAKI